MIPNRQQFEYLVGNTMGNGLKLFGKKVVNIVFGNITISAYLYVVLKRELDTVPFLLWKSGQVITNLLLRTSQIPKMHQIQMEGADTIGGRKYRIGWKRYRMIIRQGSLFYWGKGQFFQGAGKEELIVPLFQSCKKGNTFAMLHEMKYAREEILL